MPAATQFVLVSGQATPNLTPALDHETRPRRVVMLVTPDMTERADWLESVLRPEEIDVVRYELLDPWDVERLTDAMMRIAEAEKADADCALNVTGGTKLMALAAFDVFRGYGCEVFYVHPERDHIVWLHPRDRAASDIGNRLKLKTFLAAHGIRLATGKEPFGLGEAQLGVCKRLIEQADVFAPALSAFNTLVASATGDDLLSRPADSRLDDGSPLAQLVALFAEAECLQPLGQRIRFDNERQRFFANGGWLEAYVCKLATELKAKTELGIHDVGRALQVSSAREPSVENEIDVALLAENRLHVIECKTAKPENDPQTGDKPAHVLYKLVSLKERLGGINSRGLLVGYHPFNDHVLKRAEELKLRVLHGPQLANLRDGLERWIKEQRP